MDRKRAKFILQSYRPNGQDADDPQFDAALQEARRDSELASWFGQEQAADATIRLKLQAVAVPSDLAATIIHGQNREINRVLASRRSWWAAAAGIALLGVLALIGSRSLGRSGEVAAYRAEMVRTIAGGVTLDFRAEQLSEVQAWLAGHHPWSDSLVPAGLSTRRTIGCRSFTWRGRSVALLCFWTEQGSAAHLFVIARASLRDVPPPGQRAFVQEGSWLTASWTDSDKVYLLTMPTANRSQLEKLL